MLRARMANRNEYQSGGVNQLMLDANGMSDRDDIHADSAFELRGSRLVSLPPSRLGVEPCIHTV